MKRIVLSLLAVFFAAGSISAQLDTVAVMKIHTNSAMIGIIVAWDSISPDDEVEANGIKMPNDFPEFVSVHTDSLIVITANVPIRALISDGYGMVELDITRCPSLKYLNCENNSLLTLNISNNPELEQLIVSGNSLNVLDLSSAALLKTLQCSNNELTTLDLSMNPKLEKITCKHNQLTELDLSKNLLLKEIDCQNNQLSALDISTNTNLTKLYAIALFLARPTTRPRSSKTTAST